MARREVKAVREVPAEVREAFVAEFVSWRAGGCQGYGFWADYSARLGKAARRHGRSMSELWAEVHREAECRLGVPAGE